MKKNVYAVKGINEVEVKKQEILLYNEILFGLCKSKFKIFSMECGIGKTILSEKYIAEAAIKYNLRFVFVRQKKEDTAESAKRINQHVEEMLSKSNPPHKSTSIALAINEDNYKHKNRKNMDKKILNTPIIVITHARYKLISKGEGKNVFKHGRNTLIIDEKIEMVDPIEITKDHLNRFEGRLNRELREIFVKATSALFNALSEHKNQMKMYRPKNKVKILETLKYLLKKLTNPKIKKEHLRYIVADWDDQKYNSNSSNYFVNFIENLIYIHEGPSIITRNSNKSVMAVTFDPTLQYWMLDNNIILDANGRFDHTYQLGDLFDVMKLPLVTDHSNWIIYHSALATHESAKKKYKNFYDMFNLFTLDNKYNLGKTLLIGSKDEINGNKIVDHRLKYFKRDYDGNFPGSNNYRNFDSVVLLHTLQLPMHAHVLNYLYHNELKDLDDRMLTTGSGKKNIFGYQVYSFKNKHLQKLRVSNIASRLYQGIKRVNRDNSKPAKVYIAIHDENVLNLITRQMMNVKIEVWNHSPVSLLEKHKKKNFLVDELILLLENLDYGFITKKELKSILYAGKSDTTKASINSGFSKIVKDDRLKRYCKENNIEITTRNFIKHRENIA